MKDQLEAQYGEAFYCKWRIDKLDNLVNSLQAVL
ncbi:hypothetical protein WwAna0483, partial [Wolbachia endosymbiont of Drosophila ananassae]